ncbi:uncharacterized protein LOC143264148 [Megachile rotundata]|uniref:uncharacterized protein LOC143264148 n=1 Tax=Megachile rotundata TaxID=143995 RepID=UPI003FD0213A
MTISMGSLVKYHAIWYQANIVKGFIDRIKFHWQTNNDVVLQIMQKYNSLGKQLSILFASFTYPVGAIMLLYHFSPIILDKIAPLNESRPIKSPTDAELFFDKERHPIPAIIVYYLWTVVFAVTYIGTESLTIMICLHTASLFEVTSYHFQAAIFIEVTNTCIPRKHTNNKNISYLIKTVIMHEEVIRYNTSWYKTSVATQKLLQMVILRSNKGSTFKFYNMFDASLRGFSVLFQTSLSYFTVLVSLQ